MMKTPTAEITVDKKLPKAKKKLPRVDSSAISMSSPVKRLQPLKTTKDGAQASLLPSQTAFSPEHACKGVDIKRETPSLLSIRPRYLDPNMFVFKFTFSTLTSDECS